MNQFNNHQYLTEIRSTLVPRISIILWSHISCRIQRKLQIKNNKLSKRLLGNHNCSSRTQVVTFWLPLIELLSVSQISWLKRDNHLLIIGLLPASRLNLIPMLILKNKFRKSMDKLHQVALEVRDLIQITKQKRGKNTYRHSLVSILMWQLKTW